MRILNGVAEPKMEVENHLDSLWEVLLHNDDHNTQEFVMFCLIQVFGHNMELALKIMLEAHQRGSAVAEVEEKESALVHCKQLLGYGLTASVRAV